MKRLLHGFATLPFFASVAMAQEPVQLTNNQMDRVTAGESLSSLQIDPSNVPGGVLVAKVKAEAFFGPVVDAFQSSLASRFGLIIPGDEAHQFGR